MGGVREGGQHRKNNLNREAEVKFQDQNVYFTHFVLLPLGAVLFEISFIYFAFLTGM